MTTQSASARPYSVSVEVPFFFSGLATFKNSTDWINRSLEPGQLDAYNEKSSRVITVLACVFSSVILWAIPMMAAFIFGLSAAFKGDLVTLSRTLGLVALGVTMYIVSDRYIGRRQKALTATTQRLVGHLAPWPKGDSVRDLRRIQGALTTLQTRHGSAYDDQAREAVAAVLDQNLHRPTEKHLVIAGSTAHDKDSEAIRNSTLEAKTAWSRDVARAEHLILELEAAAAGKVPA